MVLHFPGPAYSSLRSFLVRHFQVLQIQRPRKQAYLQLLYIAHDFDPKAVLSKLHMPTII